MTSMWLSNHLKDVSATEESDVARSRDQEFGHVRAVLHSFHKENLCLLGVHSHDYVL